jgi:putative FmdB family regulatory protein
MPLYDYKCRKCGHRFEELVRLGDTPDCPACHACNPEKLFSTSAGITTDRDRKRTAKQARRVASAIKREKDHADREYERNYIKDHS